MNAPASDSHAHEPPLTCLRGRSRFGAAKARPSATLSPPGAEGRVRGGRGSGRDARTKFGGFSPSRWEGPGVRANVH